MTLCKSTKEPITNETTRKPYIKLITNKRTIKFKFYKKQKNSFEKKKNTTPTDTFRNKMSSVIFVSLRIK